MVIEIDKNSFTAPKINILELINLHIKKKILSRRNSSRINKKIIKKNNPKILIKYGNLFSKILTDNPNWNMPIKYLIDFAKCMAKNSNP